MADKPRVAFFYPSRAMRNPVDIPSIWSSPRGLTGSEVSFFRYAMEISRLGYGVTIFTSVTRPADLERITCTHYSEWDTIYNKQPWDVLVTWMLPDPLATAPAGALRVYDQQVSDFAQCNAGWESHVDIIAPLTSSHARYVRPMCSVPQDKWRVMHNGVDLSDFKPGAKVPGKMIWASSHDRGLHWLLEAFPRVKARAPHAELHVFYDTSGMDSFSRIPDLEPNPVFRELGARSRYCMDALRRLEGRGVHVHRSVSRDRIREEMATASVLAYPCDPVRYTETFGVTVLEACASGAVPVICAADCFTELWAPACPHVPPPYASHKPAYEDLLVEMLTDEKRRQEASERCVEHARGFEWSKLGRNLEQLILTRGAAGLPEVQW